MNESRPDPDALLRRVQRNEAKRGRLKVFFGASPGVGKTYAMLEAARAKRSEGVDVVIGWIETHGRAETAALAEGFERIPPREVEHRGARMREFDLDAAGARKPTLLVLDELAHTNAEGSRHSKRWQDAEELLDAGIDVYTTLNVQHLASLNDLVNQVTGVVVRETVPDHVLDKASEVEFVDLPPDGLLQRLAEGKVYVPEQAARAVRSFFRKGNLIALRELALRRTAERVDEDMQEYRRDHAIETTWPVAERFLICIRPNPESDKLVRAARRLAARLHADWIVAYIESPSQPPLTAPEREMLSRTTKLAEQLGADVAVLSGDDVAQTLVNFARERNVSRIIVGKPAHARWRDRLHGSLLDDIVRLSGEIDVHIISGDPDTQPVGPAIRILRRSPLSHYGWASAVVLASTAICWAMHPHFDRSNLIMVYLLGVAFAATRLGRGPSLWATCLSVAAFDFFFVPPHLTLSVSDTQYVVTFAVMLVVGLLISRLAVRVRDQANAAIHREHRTRVLYAMSRELAAQRSPEEVAEVATRHVSALFRGPAVALAAGSDGALALVSREGTTAIESTREHAVAQWVFDHGRSAGLGTDTLPGSSMLFTPLKGPHRTLGVLGVSPDEALRPLSPDQVDVLETLAHQLAIALDRSRLAAEAEKAHLAAESERLRNTLLSSVSHDLRTPLAVITGAASTLRQQPSPSDAIRDELTLTIYEEAERLSRLVADLLAMTRLESGSLTVDKQWVPIEEVVGSALGRVGPRLGGRTVTVHIPADLPLASVDPVLLEQVFWNLFDNAVSHTPAGTPIDVTARSDGSVIEVEVADRGPGLPEGMEKRVFEKFFRGPNAPSGGSGLGLAICRGLLDAQGGTIEAAQRPGGGAVFRIRISNEGAAPPAPPEATDAG